MKQPTAQPTARQAAVRIDGEQVRTLRQLAGRTQGELAELVELSAVYISYIESGKRATVSPSVFVRLCDALGVEDRRGLMLEVAA